jgi:SAM-dependent methyltransferase
MVKLDSPGRSRRWAVRRAARDVVLRIRHRGDHVAYYRAVMEDTVTEGAARAVGNSERKRWQQAGARQFKYLRGHGLQPHHTLLEIGCGNLRAGHRFIGYLDTGNYYGVDISPAVLLAAQQTVVREGVRDKLPHLSLVEDMRFEFLPDASFDVVHAHSVFSHSPLSVIEECFTHIGRILKPEGFFDFTFNRTDGRERQVLREDFYYRTDTLVELADRCGLDAAFMDDWEAMQLRQSKIRVRPRRAASSTATSA